MTAELVRQCWKLPGSATRTTLLADTLDRRYFQRLKLAELSSGADSCSTPPTSPPVCASASNATRWAITATLGHERGCDHLATHAHRSEESVQVITRRSRLVTGPELGRVGEGVDQTTNRGLVMEDAVDDRVVAVGLEHRDGDRVL
jgi:hypothetical protein